MVTGCIRLLIVLQQQLHKSLLGWTGVSIGRLMLDEWSSNKGGRFDRFDCIFIKKSLLTIMVVNIEVSL